jgi:hypothetical protein
MRSVEPGVTSQPATLFITTSTDLCCAPPTGIAHIMAADTSQAMSKKHPCSDRDPRQDLYYPLTSTGLQRERPIGGDSYSEGVRGIEVCLTETLSEIMPLSGSGGTSASTRMPQAATPLLPQQPVLVFSSPYYTAEDAPSTTISCVGPCPFPPSTWS